MGSVSPNGMFAMTTLIAMMDLMKRTVQVIPIALDLLVIQVNALAVIKDAICKWTVQMVLMKVIVQPIFVPHISSNVEQDTASTPTLFAMVAKIAPMAAMRLAVTILKDVRNFSVRPVNVFSIITFVMGFTTVKTARMKAFARQLHVQPIVLTSVPLGNVFIHQPIIVRGAMGTKIVKMAATR